MPTAITDVFDAELIRRYDTRAPRYTSYPTADHFHPGFGPSDYQRVMCTGMMPHRRCMCTFLFVP